MIRRRKRTRRDVGIYDFSCRLKVETLSMERIVYVCSEIQTDAETENAREEELLVVLDGLEARMGWDIRPYSISGRT